jgi:cytochrome c biogenesis protein CcdA/thiol-disulfide isomerase/thioredoxin
MFSLFFTSYLSGILTILAPCVLPLLPIIIGSSVSGSSKWKPVRITLSLAFSIIAFTLLLKVSTALIGIDPFVWKVISGGIVIFFGLITLFPKIWNTISLKLGLSSSSDKLLEKAGEKQGVIGDILMGMALGPVFASCSPTYGLILATVLPVNFAEGLLYLSVYSLGLATVLLGVSILGRKLINKLKFAANPDGLFKKFLGVLFILVGLAVITGFDKKVEAFVLDSGFFDVTKLEQKLLPSKEEMKTKTTSLKDDSALQKANVGDKTEEMLKGFMPKPKSIPELNIKGDITAPEIIGITKWINSKGETLENLKGKVVLVDFWTYSCINCVRTLPYITKLYDTYKDKGLVVIGVHAPEFAFEKVPANVEKAVKDAKINYPVGLDNDFATWNAYKNQYWPASYLIDKEGKIRRTHFGEGEYNETEKAVRFLLDEESIPMVAGTVVSDKGTGKFCKDDLCVMQTPETYLGKIRAKNQLPDNTNPNSLKSNNWILSGGWQQTDESAKISITGSILMQINAKKVYLVAGSDKGGRIKASLNGKLLNTIEIKENKLYTMIDSSEFVIEGNMQLEFEGDIEANALTFG